MSELSEQIQNDIDRQLIEKQKELRIGLAIPVIDSVPGEAYGSHLVLAAEMTKYGRIVFFVPFNTMPHDAARTDAMEGVLKHECDYLFFVDDDMLIPAGAFGELFRVMKESGCAVISGHYLRRGWDYTCVWSKRIGDSYKRVEAGEGVHEIDCSGLGCALINLKWIREKLPKAPWFKMDQNDKHTSITDDTVFFRLVKEQGGLVLGHAGVRCGHYGQRTLVCDSTATPLRQMYLREEKMYSEHGEIVKDKSPTQVGTPTEKVS